MFERPEHVVLGKRQYDQSWIDGNVEAGVGACGWARPGPRPPALDAPSGRARAAPLVLAPAVKKPGVVRRTVNRVLHRAPPGAVAPLPPQRPFDLGEQPAPVVPAAVEPEPAPPPAPPPPPRSDVDELLSPNSPVPQAPKRRCKLMGVFC